MKTKYLGMTCFVIVIALLMMAALELPDFGEFQRKHVASYYLANALEDTGSANAVNSIVWDYRGYDTLGEETVLFSAALCVLVIIGDKGRKDGLHSKDDE